MNFCRSLCFSHHLHLLFAIIFHFILFYLFIYFFLFGFFFYFILILFFFCLLWPVVDIVFQTGNKLEHIVHRDQSHDASCQYTPFWSSQPEMWRYSLLKKAFHQIAIGEIHPICRFFDLNLSKSAERGEWCDYNVMFANRIKLIDAAYS